MLSTAAPADGDARVRPPHSQSAEMLAAELLTDPRSGLEDDEAARRLAAYGANRPRSTKRPPYLRLALNQLLDPLVALLMAASVVSVAIGETIEGTAIAAVLLLNGVLGFLQEIGAERAVRALSQAFTQTATVVRGGRPVQIPAEDVVPGDVLLVADGDRVAADARMLDEQAIEVDESALTGESLPVSKQAAPVAVETPLAERTAMLYAGTAVTRGRGRALVCATGPATELGNIERLTSTAKPPQTPLERRLSRLARQMVIAGMLVTALLAGALLWRGEPLHDAFLLGVAVAVAAIPEGLAATVTVALAFGARMMAKRGAIVRRLEAIETLGQATVICSDKTGTLTENRIEVAGLRPSEGVSETELVVAAVLASSARQSEGGFVGDPIEVALLREAQARGISPADLLPVRVLVHELPFDSDRKRMTVVYDDRRGRHAYGKGAPEVVAAGDDELLDDAAAWAAKGLRVLAVAATGVDPERALDATLELQLVPLGLIALHDPLRPSAAPAVAAAARAGISVRMLTGDHPLTARTIGSALGLPADAVVARATPADKLALVTALQESGEVVAVTGDGVNDAPALRRADVGIAMGRSGTEAAREAAAVVLTDDDFATIIAAVEEGRRIGDNIRKFVAFLLSANLGEVIIFAVAVTAGLDPPLAVIQVLLINLITDGLPAVALARDPVGPWTMTSPPRRSHQLFDRHLWLALALIGATVGAAATAAYLAGRAYGGGVAQTMAFATLALSELAVVFGLRSQKLQTWHLLHNRWLEASAAASALIVGAVVYLPAAHAPFATVALGLWPALTALALAAVPLAAVEAAKAVMASPKRVGGGSSGKPDLAHRLGHQGHA